VALTFEQKERIAAEVKEVASNAIIAIAAEYRGLTVGEMTELRSKARESDIYLRVVKNTIARRVFEETDFKCMNDAWVGPIILAFGREDPGAPARLFRDFAKKHENLKVKALSMEGELLEADQLNVIASLPTRDEALAQLLSVMQAPIVKLARTLSEVYASFVRVVAIVGDKKGE